MMTKYSTLPTSERGADDHVPVHEEAPQSKVRKVATATAILFVVAALSAVVVSPSVRTVFTPELAVTTEEMLMPSGELERRTGRALNDGLFENLVRAHAVTKLELKSGKPAVFYVATSAGSKHMTRVNDVEATSVDHVFTDIGTHAVHAVVTQADGSTITHEFRAVCKIIRAEISDLTEEDREIYFDALVTFQFTSQADGAALYGKHYKSLEYILRNHLYGAADLECDHWHDDAGMLNHHVAITWQFEQSIRTIDPRTASHYWDYTRESAKGLEWYNSNIFSDNWFGDNSPNNKDHVVTKGKFAYSPVFMGIGFSDITNPYGLLRSPWNTNPTPYVVRYNRTFYAFADSDSSFPACTDFASTVGMTLAETIFKLNGALHGPVHIMIGGHWGNSKKWTTMGEGMPLTDKFLLLSKWLWRQGFVRTPHSCSLDTAQEDCMPTCPEGIIGTDLTEEEAYNILDVSGVLALTPDTTLLKTLLDESGLGYTDLLTELCHVGSPGDMFTSAAPQDPTFWPLHGNSERLVSLYRILKKQGKISFDETWGYTHSANLPSDTGMICDWSEATGTLDMPTCTAGICSGHKEDDLLPFTDLGKGQGDTLYTNAEFYAMIDPFSSDLPYAYDTLNYWEGCEGQSIIGQYNYDNYGSVSTSSESMWDKLYNGVWGVM